MLEMPRRECFILNGRRNTSRLAFANLNVTDLRVLSAHGEPRVGFLRGQRGVLAFEFVPIHISGHLIAGPFETDVIPLAGFEVQGRAPQCLAGVGFAGLRALHLRGVFRDFGAFTIDDQASDMVALGIATDKKA